MRPENQNASREADDQRDDEQQQRARERSPAAADAAPARCACLDRLGTVAAMSVSKRASMRVRLPGLGGLGSRLAAYVGES